MPHSRCATPVRGQFCYGEGALGTLRGPLECAGHLLVKVIDVAKNLAISLIPASARREEVTVVKVAGVGGVCSDKFKEFLFILIFFISF